MYPCCCCPHISGHICISMSVPVSVAPGSRYLCRPDAPNECDASDTGTDRQISAPTCKGWLLQRQQCFGGVGLQSYLYGFMQWHQTPCQCSVLTQTADQECESCRFTAVWGNTRVPVQTRRVAFCASVSRWRHATSDDDWSLQCSSSWRKQSSSSQAAQQVTVQFNVDSTHDDSLSA